MDAAICRHAMEIPDGAKPTTKGQMSRGGTEVSKVMAPASRFGAKAAERDDKRHRVADRLSDYYRKFRSLTAHYPNLEDDL